MYTENPPWASCKEEDGHQGTDLWCFAEALLSAKHDKSIPRVTIFFLIAMPWWILCLPIT